MAAGLCNFPTQRARRAAADGGVQRDTTARELDATRAQLAARSAELLKRDQELAQIKGWFDLALNNMLRGLSVFDAEARLLFCNDTYKEIYELPDHLALRGTPLAEIVRLYVKTETGKDGPDEIAAQREWITDHVSRLARGEVFSHTQHLKSGRVVLVTNKPLSGGGWVDIQEDITERRKAEQQINWLARHDPLTEVANRLQFQEALDGALKNLRPTVGFALHWIDLDRFKHVNDTYGHPVGDALLRSIAKRLRSTVRENDVVARLGGDEFVVLQAGADDWNSAGEFAGRLLDALRPPHVIHGHSLQSGASIGIALAPQHGRTAEDLVKSADVALYAAKNSGRNGFAFADFQDHTVPVGDSPVLERVGVASRRG